MNNTLLISFGILGSLIGTIAGAAISLLGKGNVVQRLAQIVMMTGLGLGTLASGAFLVLNLGPIIIFGSASLFPGELIIDHFSAIFFLLVCSIGFLAVLYGFRYVQNEKHLYNICYVQFLTALFLLGMQMVVLANNTVFFLFSWEIMSLSSFILVMADFKNISIRAAIFYLIMTHLGAAAILGGFLLISNGSLALSFSQMQQLIPQLPAFTVVFAFILFFFGFGSKSGLFPFHGWLPEAHPQAPSHISALMSGVMLKIAVYGFLRIMISIFPIMPEWIGILVVVVGLFSAVFGVVYAAIDTDIKRILAFSSIENLGLIFAMIGIFMLSRSFHIDQLAQISLLIILFQSICHAFSKSGLFFSAGVAVQAFHTRNIEKMGGMARKMKLFSFSVLVLAITAAALPPSGTFVAEWLTFQSIITQIMAAPVVFKIVMLIAFVVFGFVAGVAVFAMVRFFGISFLAKPRSQSTHIQKDPNPELLLPIVILAFMSFGLGSVSQFVIKILGQGVIGESYKNSINTAFNLDGTSFNPSLLLPILVLIIFVVFVLRYIFSDSKNERIYHTWDCGQDVDSSMEYTGKAFASPLRFFFSPLLRASKKIGSKPVIAANPWIVKKNMHLEVRPIWEEYFYKPVVNLVTYFSGVVRKLQNGVIQFYIALILITLITTAILAL